MPALKAGDVFPSDVVFKYIPWTEEKKGFKTCGVPVAYDASKEWANKKVVLVSVPGAFTPTCSATHLPDYVSKLGELKNKGVDNVVVIAFNDPFVMSAWGKANGVTGDDILFLSDAGSQFSSAFAWTAHEGRTGRYAMVIDHGKVIYSENEPAIPNVTVSGVDAVLAAL
ncbi:hypothetical protein MGYG_01381 [Nannizzia gypsea CBS 118893]|uniref:Thioredoxin peroxidase n=1 Tax=Arthroderma gypseum (strain ATCC MYA-4604 / CBS 118893) TaxID=535722 RepID=E5R0K4_ARTGP|nr:hypothetical protein MGYG_01381 [Nannizzia gypsea CBS 118893]EFQ98348.1 hypothetical protein MGYG_01381 [Nannizzia gypsea CBS 118893]